MQGFAAEGFWLWWQEGQKYLICTTKVVLQYKASLIAADRVQKKVFPTLNCIIKNVQPISVGV